MGRPVQGMDVGEPRGVAIVSGHRTYKSTSKSVREHKLCASSLPQQLCKQINQELLLLRSRRPQHYAKPFSDLLTS